MPVGLTIYNDAGTIQVDGLSPSLGLEITSTANNIALGSLEFAVGAVRSTDWAGPAFQASTTFTWRRPVGGAATVTSYIFARPTNVSTFGLHVLDAAGKTTFDALQKPGRVVHVFTAAGTFNGVVGRTYAVAILTPRQAQQWVLDSTDGVNNTWEVTERFAAAKVNGAVVVVDFEAIREISLQAEPVGVTPNEYDTWAPTTTGLALVLDVTNY